MNMTWLARAHPDCCWAHLTTTEFPAAASRPGAIAVLPVSGHADHGMGLPINAEEAVLADLLAEACGDALASCAPCILPPLRFGPSPHPASTWFGINAVDGRDLVLELARGVRFAGFQKLLIFSSSPWHREWLDAAARDARVELGIVVYRVHLASLGLDFHPAAALAVRQETQALAATLLGVVPVPSAPQRSSDEQFRPGNWHQPPPLQSGPVDAACVEAAGLTRRQAVARLGRLLEEAAWHGHTKPALVASLAASRPANAVAPLWRPFGNRYLGALTPEALRTAAQRSGAVAILPTGAIEQHGPHLPVGVDAMIGQGLLARALALLADELPAYVAPPVTIGKSNEHADWTGTLTLTYRTFARLVRTQIEQLHQLGFRRIALFNTHGGNSAVLVALIRELQQMPGLRLGMLQSAYKPDQNAQEAAYGFHAGEWETSIMLALAPGLVRRSLAVCHHPADINAPCELRPEGAALNLAWSTRDLAPEGVMGDATVATPEKGELWAEGAARSLAEAVQLLAKAD